jgi:hypothetical protein
VDSLLSLSFYLGVGGPRSPPSVLSRRRVGGLFDLIISDLGAGSNAPCVALRCVALRCAPISLIQLLMRRGDSLSLFDASLRFGCRDREMLAGMGGVARVLEFGSLKQHR